MRIVSLSCFDGRLTPGRQVHRCPRRWKRSIVAALFTKEEEVPFVTSGA
jgi:hypothetical protein